MKLLSCLILSLCSWKVTLSLKHITTFCQGMLEEKLGKLYINLSLHQTLDQLLRERYLLYFYFPPHQPLCHREVKLADKLKSEFKLSERKYFWLKVMLSFFVFWC